MRYCKKCKEQFDADVCKGTAQCESLLTRLSKVDRMHRLFSNLYARQYLSLQPDHNPLSRWPRKLYVYEQNSGRRADPGM